jgi:hypothetical protein
MYIGLLYSCSILIKLEYPRQCFEKHSDIKFHENPSSGSQDLPCRQTDGRAADMMKLTVAFRKFAKAPKNESKGMGSYSGLIWGISKVLLWMDGARLRKCSEQSASRPLPYVRSVTARTAWDGPVGPYVHLPSTHPSLQSYPKPWHCTKSITLSADHRTWDDLPTGVGMCGEMREDCWPQKGLLDWFWYDRQAPLLIYSDWKHQVFHATCSECVHSATAFRMGSSNSPFTSKSCACASIAFLAWVIPWSVDSTCISFNIRHIKKGLK